MKKTIFTICLLMAATTTFSGGLYLVSGSDFRPCNIKYQLLTTTENQTLEVTPKRVFPLANYNNTLYEGPWSVKTQGQEFNFTPYETIPGGSSLGPNGVEIQPLQFTYALPGSHLVKIYDEWGNIYQLGFNNWDDLYSLHIDWSLQKSAQQYSRLQAVTIWNNANLKKVYIKYSYFGTESVEMAKNMFNTLTNIDECIVLGTERFVTLNNNFRFNFMTNGLSFPNVTTITGNCFTSSQRISYLSVPNARVMYGQTCGLSRGTQNEPLTDEAIIGNNWGLKAIRIGDALETIGLNSFWRQVNLNTVEFVTDEEDWIGKWNSMTLLTQFFG